MTYTKYIYNEEISNYETEEMTKEDCKTWLVNHGYYCKDIETLDYMLTLPQKLPIMGGYIEIIKWNGLHKT